LNKKKICSINIINENYYSTKEEVMEGQENKENVIVNQFDAGVPSKISTWTKIKNFLFQEIRVELTPRQAEVFNSINSFWHQEITDEQANAFIFQKMKF